MSPRAVSTYVLVLSMPVALWHVARRPPWDPEAGAAMLEAVHAQDTAAMARAAAAGAPLDRPDRCGSTPLDYASVFARLRSARWLIDRGADVNRPGPKGLTPLIMAVGSGHDSDAGVRMVRLLLEAGAQVDTRADSGLTALCLACQLGLLPEAELLIEAGADVNGPGPGGVTPLAAAAAADPPCPELVRRLIDAGADAGAGADGGGSRVLDGDDLEDDGAPGKFIDRSAAADAGQTGFRE